MNNNSYLMEVAFTRDDYGRMALSQKSEHKNEPFR